MSESPHPLLPDCGNIGGVVSAVGFAGLPQRGLVFRHVVQDEGGVLEPEPDVGRRRGVRDVEQVHLAMELDPPGLRVVPLLALCLACSWKMVIRKSARKRPAVSQVWPKRVQEKNTCFLWTRAWRRSEQSQHGGKRARTSRTGSNAWPRDRRAGQLVGHGGLILGGGGDGV